jgi:superfamily I DNA/RNA helicase
MTRERGVGPGTRPGRILALTFTNRAARELKDRVALLVPEETGQTLAATFHSFCWSILREHDSALLTVYSPAHRADLLALIMPALTPADVKSLAARMERCWEGMEKPDPPLRSAIDAYESELRRIGGADISSLVGRLVEILKEDAPLLAELRERFSVIAVDELQDINTPQYELLMLLCETAEAVLCIGDPDQAIYGFRGSDRELFFRFRAETGARSFTLSRNYRSSGMIVAAADALIAAGRTPGVPPLTSPRESGPKIRIFGAADRDEEGKFIASAIRDLVGGVDSVSVDAARVRGPGSLAFSDIAVLFRTRAVRDALLPALAAAGLPLTFGTGTPIAEEEPFHSLIAALHLVVNPADRVSLHTLRAHLATRGSPGSLDDFLACCGALAVKSSAEGIGAIIDEILGTVVRFDRSVPVVEVGEEVIRESAAEHGGDLPGFLARVSLCARESEGPRTAQKVSLLTFHAAKGLEFPVVFIAGAEEGITPLGDDPEEERRLFYVAVTRARDLLHITHSRRRRTYGQLKETAPSRYLSEIPQECRAKEAPRPPHRTRQLTLFN